jgi:hypothetical protein
MRPPDFPDLLELTAMNDSTMTKADLVEEVIRITELPRKESEAIVETIFDSIITALQTGDKIEILFAVEIEEKDSLAAGDYQGVATVGLQQELFFALDYFFGVGHRESRILPLSSAKR